MGQRPRRASGPPWGRGSRRGVAEVGEGGDVEGGHHLVLLNISQGAQKGDEAGTTYIFVD